MQLQSKVTLAKKGDSHVIQLVKKGASDIIEVNLNWSQPVAPPKKSGFFGAISNALNQPAELDLDLGALYELKDGQKSVIQPLGNCFGALDYPPYLAHSGDDRSGASASGEFLRIKTANWHLFRRVCIYAYIYSGAPDWATAKGVIRVKVPGQPDLEVPMGEQRDPGRLCAICMLENQNDNVSVTKLITFHDGSRTGTWQSDLDAAYGWGMNWVSGRK